MQFIQNRHKRSTLLFRFFLFVVGLLFLFGFTSFVWLKIDPISFRQVAFEPLRDSLFFYRELQPITGWRQIRKPPTFNRQILSIPSLHPSDLTLVADLWKPESESDIYPAILILHGSSSRGRRHCLVQMLANKFLENGWIVLTPDMRGFGKSENPRAIHEPENWRIANDISRCLDFFYKLANVDKQRIFVLGHSMGAANALEGALDDSRVSGIVLIGPPRYLSSNGATFWRRVRFSAVRDLSEVISEKVVAESINSGDISRYAREGQLKNSIPILLIDGKLEKETEHCFLKEVFHRLSASSEYHTVPGVGHYCGVYHVPGTAFMLWRQDLFEACTKPILEFLEKIPQSNLKSY